MSAATPSTDTCVTPDIRAASRLAKLPVLVAGVIAALAGAIVLYAYGAVAKALSGPMRAGEIGASHARAITPASFASGVVFCTVAGTILAMASPTARLTLRGHSCAPHWSCSRSR